MSKRPEEKRQKKNTINPQSESRVNSSQCIKSSVRPEPTPRRHLYSQQKWGEDGILEDAIQS